MLTGLVSVTFRELSPAEIIKLVKGAGLDCIEWGADIHCPPGDVENAKKVAAMMAENGLKTVSYGTYYHIYGKADNADFNTLMQTAEVLKTDNLRIWAGQISSQDADEAVWKAAVTDAQRCADIAAEKGKTVSFEYHCNTLTDTLATTVQLLEAVNRDNVFTYWQPQAFSKPEENVKDIQTLLKMQKLKNLHVFSWEDRDRLSLDAHADRWPLYVNAAAPCNPALLMEFVKETTQFAADAKYLKTLVEG